MTFASFNALPKLNEATIELWASVLHAVPGSRLLLKAWPLSSASVRERMTAAFGRHGVAPERVAYLHHVRETGEHLAMYAQVDVALDTFPYNGTTTTCEALWMGVPVVTLSGDRHAARVGSSLLRAVGLGRLVAHSPSEFVSIASSIAGDSAQLGELRSSLRERIQGLGLGDATAFTARFEDAILSAWQG